MKRILAFLLVTLAVIPIGVSADSGEETSTGPESLAQQVQEYNVTTMRWRDNKFTHNCMAIADEVIAIYAAHANIDNLGCTTKNPEISLRIIKDEDWAARGNKPSKGAVTKIYRWPTSPPGTIDFVEVDIWEPIMEDAKNFRRLMVHEFGAVFGLRYSDDFFSVMRWDNHFSQLSQSDIKAIQLIYGPPNPLDDNLPFRLFTVVSSND